MSSILIIQSGFLGDAVLASGMLRAIAATRRDVEVGLVVRAAFAELFVDHPGVARVHAFDKKSREGTRALIEQLRSHNYPTALLPHRSFRTQLITWRAGIPRRIGFRQCDAPWLLTDRVEYDITRHETERNAMLLRGAGINPTKEQTASWLIAQPAAVEAMRARFDTSRAIVVVAPGSVWPTKRWSVEGFAAAARSLRKSHQVVLVGSGDERELCEAAARASRVDGIENLAGRLSLVELLALISISERVITNDSAPLHLAESVGVPVTAIFGPTVPEFGFGPRLKRSRVVEIAGLDCRPCRIHGSVKCPIGTHECMQRITAEMVVKGLGGRGL